MEINNRHIELMRSLYTECKSEKMVSLYVEMVDSIKPKITDSMMASTQLVVEGNTVEEASTKLQISKVAVSQASVKGLNRLAQFWLMMGGEVPDELSGEKDFNMNTAKRHLEFFSKAVKSYNNPQITITW